MKKIISISVLTLALGACAEHGAGNYGNYDGTLSERGMRRCTYWDDCGTARPKAAAKPAEAPAEQQAAAEPAKEAPAQPAEQAPAKEAAPAPAPVAAAVAEKAPGRAEGKVTSTDGSPLAAFISISKDGDPVKNTPTKDAAYSEDLAEGEYLIRASATDHEPQAKTVKVAAGKPTKTDFVLVPSSKALARVEGNKIVILQTVYFATSKADILAKSNDLLNDVARVLVDNPQIKKVEVAGHTDTVGDAGANKRLSQSRANSVKAYLVKKGVAADRLTPVGYGEEKPVVSPDDTKDKQAQNRRVEFVVLDPAQN